MSSVNKTVFLACALSVVELKRRRINRELAKVSSEMAELQRLLDKQDAEIKRLEKL
jgi:hypothetical protein